MPKPVPRPKPDAALARLIAAARRDPDPLTRRWLVRLLTRGEQSSGKGK
jgi:hypothetical protein